MNGRLGWLKRWVSLAILSFIFSQVANPTLLMSKTRHCFRGDYIMDRIVALTLGDNPRGFESNATVVIGRNAPEKEHQAAETTVGKAKVAAGNKPIIRKDVVICERDEMNAYLTLLKTPRGSAVLKHIREITDTNEVSNNYPGKNEGVPQILWNRSDFDRISFTLVGSDEWGVYEESELPERVLELGRNNTTLEWWASKDVCTRTIPPDKYVFLETERTIEIEPRPPHLMIQRYPLTYYFDERSGSLRIRAMRGAGVDDELTLTDDLLVLIGNTVILEGLMGSGRGIMPPVCSIPFSSEKGDLDFLKILGLKSDGTVYVRCKDTTVVLGPAERYETSFGEAGAVHRVTIKNHGLLDKEKVTIEQW